MAPKAPGTFTNNPYHYGAVTSAGMSPYQRTYGTAYATAAGNSQYQNALSGLGGLLPDGANARYGGSTRQYPVTGGGYSYNPPKIPKAPRPGNISVSGSIPREVLTPYHGGQYYPDELIAREVAQAHADLSPTANLAQQYAATQDNLVSLASGQAQQRLMRDFAEAYNNQARAAAQAAMAAQLQRYNQDTQSMSAMADEILGLAQVARAGYEDQLNNFAQSQRDRLQLMALLA